MNKCVKEKALCDAIMRQQCCQCSSEVGTGQI
jgi:hypothetical protein